MGSAITHVTLSVAMGDTEEAVITTLEKENFEKYYALGPSIDGEFEEDGLLNNCKEKQVISNQPKEYVNSGESKETIKEPEYFVDDEAEKQEIPIDEDKLMNWYPRLQCGAVCDTCNIM